MVRADGEVLEPKRFRCASPYCQTCSRYRNQRVYACINRVLSSTQTDEPWMVTITHGFPKGLSAYQLRQNLEQLADVQREAHQTLRDHDYAHARLEHWRARGDADKVERWRLECQTRLPHPASTVSATLGPRSLEYASSWNKHGGFPRAAFGSTTYVWAREITTGADEDHWHVHFHYIVPSRADAERINAAWQSSRQQRRLLRTDITGPDDAHQGIEADERDPVAYVTAYVSKSEVQNIGRNHRWAYQDSVRHRRAYDAAGRWRPLGIGRKRDPDTPPVRWVMVRGEMHDAAEWWAGRSEGWYQWGAHVLEAERRSDEMLEAQSQWLESIDTRLKTERSGVYLAQYRTSLSSADDSPSSILDGLTDELSEPKRPPD